MREILFRGKRVDNGDWCYGVPLVEGWSKTTYISSYEYSSLAFVQQIEVIPETLGQFTGLTDKNGKRIWENDIVTAHFKSNRTKQTFRVIYDCGMFLFDNGCVKVNSWDIFSLKVIGNSIDNSELLTAERSDNENQ